ncbi:MAG: glucose-6-phosphate isomerase [Gammaproteobacteria bacterium]|nr:glucose-6-phosphate isomerase [Gammaproteobacteria bacterium]
MNHSSQTSRWRALSKIATNLASSSKQFLADEDRYDQFSFEASGILLDLSKQKITREILQELLSLANEKDLANKIEALFSGGNVNITENRPALHTILRNPDGDDERAKQVRSDLQRIESCVTDINTGRWRGYSGKSITQIVHIGIGGSHLGQALVTEALKKKSGNLQIAFVTNMDPEDLESTLLGIDAERTIFIIASKSFSTIETIENATAAKNWFLGRTNDPGATTNHFLAISNNYDAAVAFGIDRKNIFPVADWVGGRYSLWSAMGLIIALGSGFDNFKRLLAGAKSMDDHFRSSPFESNLPVLLALTGIWNSNFLNINNHLILPYAERLKMLPAFLQQLEMESNGKSVDTYGRKLDINTAPLIWGGTGTDSQHSFHQLLLQGTQSFSADLILVGSSKSRFRQEQRNWLLANALAQTRAMLVGHDDEDPHKAMQGGHGTNTLVLEELNAFTLGSLLSLYEHKVFCQGAIWNINPFDQYGIEQGKQLAPSIYKQLTDGSELQWDASTNGLINQFRKGEQNG